MYNAYLLNKLTGNITNVGTPEQKYAFLIRDGWVEITEEEYKLFKLVIDFALARQFPFSLEDIS
jgi:hypothetical protein